MKHLLDLPLTIFADCGLFLNINIKEFTRLLVVSKRFSSRVLKQWSQYLQVVGTSDAEQRFVQRYAPYLHHVRIRDFETAYMTNVRSLIVWNHKDVDFSKLPKLRELVCEDKDECIQENIPRTVTRLSTYNWNETLGVMLSNITHLDLRNAKLESLAGIEKLVHLVYLDISRTEIRTLEHLRDAHSLRCLSIHRCDFITSVSVLGSCDVLEFLAVDKETTFRIRDWEEFTKKTVKLLEWGNWFKEMNACGILTKYSLFPMCL